MKHLAQINIGRLKYDADDERVAGFMNALERVNQIAERSQGFEWRYIDESGNATATRVDKDPRVIINLSSWASIEDLEGFVWGTIHRRFYQRRAEWFDALERMHFAMWWIDPKERPGVEEAMERLEHLNEHGDSDHAFGWAHLPQARKWRYAQCENRVA